MNNEPSTDMEAKIVRLQRELVCVKRKFSDQRKNYLQLKVAYAALALRVTNPADNVPRIQYEKMRSQLGESVQAQQWANIELGQLVEVLESKLDEKTEELAIERLNALKITTEQTELANLRDVYEARLADQKEELDELLKGRICTYEKTINEIEERYSMIVAVAKTKQMAAEQDVAASAERELEMSTELNAKQQRIACLNYEIETVRRAANQALVKFEDDCKQFSQVAVTAKQQCGIFEEQLQKRCTEDENQIRKYDELKAIAFDLKCKSIQRTESCESKLQEVKRLRNIIKYDEARVDQVLKEMENLREQVIQKNFVISKLESLVDRLRSCAVPEV